MGKRGHRALWLTVVIGLVGSVFIVAPTASGELHPPDPGQVVRQVKDHPRLESALSRLVAAQREDGLEGAGRLAQSQGLVLKGDVVRVVAEARPGEVEAVLQAIEARDGQVEVIYEGLVQALIPLPALEPLADLDVVRWVRRPRELRPAVVSEGVEVISAVLWQTAGYEGQGVKIAILDGGFQGYTSLLGTELPFSPTVRSFAAGGCVECGTVHGVACAEIVYDIAPQAQYIFATAHTDVEFSNAVSYLVDEERVDVISFSANWSVAGPGDGTGYLADRVNRAQSQGVLWVNSAGNFAEGHWEGAWRDDDGDNWHNFTPTDESNAIFARAGESIRVGLRWDDPWGASGNDYDLYLYRGADPDPVGYSVNTQDGDDDPVEFISYQVPALGIYHVQVDRYAANRDVYLELFSEDHDLGYRVASSSLGLPADAEGSMTVGAIHWQGLGLEPFSSQGPTNDGRIKPDLVAPDGVSTASYEPSDGRAWAIGGQGFFGTSASAPHVAGAAAVVKSAYPSYGPAQLRSFLEGQAMDMGSGGKDNLYGAGRLDLAVPVLAISSSQFVFLADVGTTLQPWSLDVLNLGAETLSWEASKSSGTPWLTICPTYGTASQGIPGTIVISVEKGSLSYGTYRGQITIHSSTPYVLSTPQTVAVTFSYVPQIGRTYLPLCLKDCPAR
jgi:subtilisin family serine protease